MKKLLLVPFACAATMASAQTILLQESFDTYTEGSGMVDNDPTHWAVWPGGEDQAISGALFQSPSNSMHCLSTDAANGGPGDLLLLLGDRTGGSYALSWSMYIPAGQGAYFNIQHTEDVTTPSFAAEVIFSGGAVTGSVNNTDLAGAYPDDTWFSVVMVIDLNNVLATLVVNGSSVASWPFNTETDGAAGLNQLGAIDFFSYGGGSALGDFYVDDVLYMDISGIGMDEATNDLLFFGPNPVDDVLTITLADNQGARVEVTDASGKLCRLPTPTNGARLQVDMADMAPGLYTVRIINGDRIITRKVVKG